MVKLKCSGHIKGGRATIKITGLKALTKKHHHHHKIKKRAATTPKKKTRLIRSARRGVPQTPRRLVFPQEGAAARRGTPTHPRKITLTTGATAGQTTAMALHPKLYQRVAAARTPPGGHPSESAFRRNRSIRRTSRK